MVGNPLTGRVLPTWGVVFALGAVFADVLLIGPTFLLMFSWLDAVFVGSRLVGLSVVSPVGHHVHCFLADGQSVW